MPLEAEVLKTVIRELEFLKIQGDVVWFRRLHNSLLYARNGTPVKMGHKRNLDEGQDLDLIVIVNCKDGTIAVLFVDVKRTGKKKMDYEQDVFCKYMEGKPKILCALVNGKGQIGALVRRAQSL